MASPLKADPAAMLLMHETAKNRERSLPLLAFLLHNERDGRDVHSFRDPSASGDGRSAYPELCQFLFEWCAGSSIPASFLIVIADQTVDVCSIPWRNNLLVCQRNRIGEEPFR